MLTSSFAWIFNWVRLSNNKVWLLVRFDFESGLTSSLSFQLLGLPVLIFMRMYIRPCLTFSLVCNSVRVNFLFEFLTAWTSNLNFYIDVTKQPNRLLVSLSRLCCREEVWVLALGHVWLWAHISSYSREKPSGGLLWPRDEVKLLPVKGTCLYRKW